MVSKNKNRWDNGCKHSKDIQIVVIGMVDKLQ